jgi:hypothetical protein
VATEVRHDPDLEWLDHVRSVGTVVAPSLLKELGLSPLRQSPIDTGAASALIEEDTSKPALADPWSFAQQVLGWEARHVAGAPGGLAIPDEELLISLPEHATLLRPTWAVAELGGGERRWQLLVRIEAAGIDPDARGALDGWEATPHQRFERLLRDTGVFAGVLITDTMLRLIYAPRGETSGYLIFPLRPLASVAGRPMLGGLKLLLDRSSLFTAADSHRLSALLRRSRDAQASVSTALAEQVLGALHELLRGLDRAEPILIRALARSRPDHLYEGLLAVLMRLVFVLYAEDRDLIPSRSDGRARQIYETSYSVRGVYAKLVEDAAHNPDTMDERRGGWGRLLALFRLIHKGHRTGFIRARGGKLFDPDEFPFLEGRATRDQLARVPAVSDGCLLRILEGLMTLKLRGGARERLSYRSLDVEQIGSVYETVMGFTVEAAPGRALAIRGGKNNRTPVFVALDELLAKKGKNRIKHLKENAGRAQLSAGQAKAIETAASLEELAASLDIIVDERGSPRHAIASAGTPTLQPTHERRRTGSHYTPRNLTAPIVKHALEPTFARLGENATPQQVLVLKVCDPAMGSGAFLVEACRAIGERLVAAWARWPETRPMIPADEDEELHARRLVAQRCLYGVDKNPRAVDLARLSLWLATLARDHEFTFLDHALKCGDSLIGLSTTQIAATHWDTTKPPTFVGKFVSDHLREAEQGRARIREQAEWATEAELRPQLRAVDAKLFVARLIGDGIISAFFSTDKPKKRIERLVEFQKTVLDHIGSSRWVEAVEPFTAVLATGEHPITPFHWQIEFPEVFARDNSGFDAIVGNPPFLGGTRIATELSKGYVEYLKNRFFGAGDRADLVSYFFRRSFDLLRSGGVFGLIASNTISQGDTRKAGLKSILDMKGTILRAQRRYKWPGEAAVTVSVLHVAKFDVSGAILDNVPVPRITCFLFSNGPNEDPAQLAENADGAFEGMVPYSDGFMMVGNQFRESADVGTWIFPFARGKIVNSTPARVPADFIVYFRDVPLALIKSETLIKAIEKHVKPDRATRSREVADAAWWLFWRPRVRLWNKIKSKSSILLRSRVSPHHAIIRYKTPVIPDTSLVVFPHEQDSWFAVLQSRVHEVWARFFSSTLEDRMRYTPSDCFRTFPLPEKFEMNAALEAAGEAYHTFRSKLMSERNEGLTKTYNRFHSRADNSPDTARLRELHAEMDTAVLLAYRWTELTDRSVPQFIEQDTDEGKTPKTRLDWPSAFKDELLVRLLALNAERSAAERACGLVAVPEEGGEEEEEGEEIGDEHEMD